MRIIKKIDYFLDEEGSMGLGFISSIVIFILIMLPILSLVFERNRINLIRNDTTTSVELALESTLASLDLSEASVETYDFESDEFENIFKSYLAYNMRLNDDLSVRNSSLVDGDVTLNELDFYGSAYLPFEDERTGKIYERPYFRVELYLIIKPSMFRKLIHEITGVEEFHYTYYHNISMPVDN